LLEESIGFVTGCLGTLTGGAGVTEPFHKGSKVGPNVFLLDYHKGFVLPGVSGKYVIMIVLEDLEVEIIDVQDVNLILMAE
jgi:hypothetical protein